VNATDNCLRTPLHWAAICPHKEMAELLLANGAKVNATDSWHHTPLHWAAQYGNKDLVELLRQHGGHEN
jgi:ankyrin repeat protein